MSGGCRACKTTVVDSCQPYVFCQHARDHIHACQEGGIEVGGIEGLFPHWSHAHALASHGAVKTNAGGRRSSRCVNACKRIVLPACVRQTCTASPLRFAWGGGGVGPFFFPGGGSSLSPSQPCPGLICRLKGQNMETDARFRGFPFF